LSDLFSEVIKKKLTQQEMLSEAFNQQFYLAFGFAYNDFLQL